MTTNWKKVFTNYFVSTDETISIDTMVGLQYYAVKRVLQDVGNRVLLEYEESDLIGQLDPLIVGTVRIDDEFVVRAIWRDKVWRSSEMNEFLKMVAKGAAEK